MVGASPYKNWGSDNKDREKSGEYCYEFFTGSINDVCLILYYPVSALDHAIGVPIAPGHGIKCHLAMKNALQRKKCCTQRIHTIQ